MEKSNLSTNCNNLNIKRIKGSLEYKKCLNQFLNDYFSACLKEGIKFENIDLVTNDYLKSGISIKLNYSKSINDFVKTTTQKIKSQFEDQYYELVKPLMIEMKLCSLRSNERKEVIDRMDILKDTLKKGCNNELKKLVKPLLISPINLYKMFLENIDKYIQLSPSETEVIKNTSLKLLKMKIIPYDDIAAISYLSILYNGVSKYEKYKHVVIDEAQDYNTFQFDVLKTIFSKSTFSIFGDLAQSIYSYRSIDSWKEIKQSIFNDNCELLNMVRSYRTTREITNLSNNILKFLNLPDAEPVIRLGEKVSFCEYENNIEKEKQYLTTINDFLQKGYKSIGIICKDETEMKKAKTLLDKYKISYNYISTSDVNYNGGISLLTSYLAKGLEFDGVIINDASEEKYETKSKVDLHLLYVAITRALHEVNVMYYNNLNLALQDSTYNLGSQKVYKK